MERCGSLVSSAANGCQKEFHVKIDSQNTSVSVLLRKHNQFSCRVISSSLTCVCSFESYIYGKPLQSDFHIFKFFVHRFFLQKEILSLLTHFSGDEFLKLGLSLKLIVVQIVLVIFVVVYVLRLKNVRTWS